MKSRFFSCFFLAIFLSTPLTSTVFAQRTAFPTVNEKNVRAQMQFLAGDAMQGRGSGTVFERIAAEYIGSQFMQFGLEPAGELGTDGNLTFVQTIDISRQTFSAAPTLQFYDKTLTHGQEMIVLRTNTASASGGLQLLEHGQIPRSGSTVILRAKESEDQRSLMQSAQRLPAGGASIILIEETPSIRANCQTSGRGCRRAGRGHASQ